MPFTPEILDAMAQRAADEGYDPDNADDVARLFAGNPVLSPGRTFPLDEAPQNPPLQSEDTSRHQQMHEAVPPAQEHPQSETPQQPGPSRHEQMWNAVPPPQVHPQSETPAQTPSRHEQMHEAVPQQPGPPRDQGPGISDIFSLGNPAASGPMVPPVAGATPNPPPSGRTGGPMPEQQPFPAWDPSLVRDNPQMQPFTNMGQRAGVQPQQQQPQGATSPAPQQSAPAPQPQSPQQPGQQPGQPQSAGIPGLPGLEVTGPQAEQEAQRQRSSDAAMEAALALMSGMLQPPEVPIAPASVSGQASQIAVEPTRVRRGNVGGLF